jgi:hypothetical protein
LEALEQVFRTIPSGSFNFIIQYSVVMESYKKYRARLEELLSDLLKDKQPLTKALILSLMVD